MTDHAEGTPQAPEVRQRFLGRMWRTVRRWWVRVHPSPAARRGAAAGVVAAAAAVAALTGAGLHIGFGVLDLPIGVIVGILLAALVGLATSLGAKVLAAIPGFVGGLGLAALGAFVWLVSMLGFPMPVAALIAVALGIAEAPLGGIVAGMARGGLRAATPAGRGLRVGVLVLGVGLNVFLVWWLAIPGWTGDLVRPPVDRARVEPIAAPDPSVAGAYQVRTLTYGSGTDRRRPEFGTRAVLRTAAVDASPFVKGNEGFKVKARRWFWGFDVKHFPRNGRVWYPEGKGPFPLVLIAHGNHTMEQFSDPGYVYLGEHLASRGFIAVSVDENFFNGSWAGGLEKENDGRGWLLLEHLKLWQEWNRAPGNPFFGKVDMTEIGLVGHSRGGEAAAIAGAFNRLARYPDDATVEFPFGFAIRSIVAIAPSDGQYSPAGKPSPLANVNYLVLQGGHDGDVSTFMGARQFSRVAFTDGGPWFKASIYAYRANHGQFNTVWGRADTGWPQWLFLNRRPLMAGADQRRLGKAVITAFLEATLRGRTAYVDLFRDPRRARAWLPDDVYVSRYADSRFRVIADFEEDIDVTTATLPGATIAGRGLAVWREQNLPPRRGEGKPNAVVALGWRTGDAGRESAGQARHADPATYEISLPEGAAAKLGVDAGCTVSLSLADAGEEPPAPEGGAEASRKAHAEKADRSPKEPLDLSVELVDRRGTAVRLPLSSFRTLTPPLTTRFTKLPSESAIYGKASEPVLQTFEVPLKAFIAASRGFDVANLTAIRLVFDRSAKGVILLDDIGIEVPGTI